MLKLYGANGRAFRCLWMLEEAGVPYERELVAFDTGDTQTDQFLAINPNGKIPVLADGPLVLFESLAINVHIARQHAAELWPSDPVDQSLVVQWLAWAMGELEGPHDAANRTQTSVDAEALQRSLEALRNVLAERDYLLGDAFTVADLNTTCVLLRPQYRAVARDDPELKSWFRRCAGRPALQRALDAISPRAEKTPRDR